MRRRNERGSAHEEIGREEESFEGDDTEKDRITKNIGGRFEEYINADGKKTRDRRGSGEERRNIKKKNEGK